MRQCNQQAKVVSQVSPRTRIRIQVCLTTKPMSFQDHRQTTFIEIKAKKNLVHINNRIQSP